MVQIRSLLSTKQQAQIITLLWKNAYIFASSQPGIDLSLIEHELNIDTYRKPIKQKKKYIGLEKQGATKEEV